MSVTADYEFDRERYVYEKPTLFQQMDWIPIISNISGTVRAIIGVVQIILGVFTLIPEMIYSVAAGESHVYLITAGALNIIRGIVAEIWIAGNIALFLYDTSRTVTVVRHK
jgi:hypothetical protein